jgi:hypothetical protein
MEDMTMRWIVGTMATTAFLLTAVSVGAQTAAPDQGQQGQMPMQNMPMMPGQPGQTPGPQSGMMGCPMMQKMAMLQDRVQQLEQKAGIPSPAQPTTPQVR